MNWSWGAGPVFGVKADTHGTGLFYHGGVFVAIMFFGVGRIFICFIFMDSAQFLHFI